MKTQTKLFKNRPDADKALGLMRPSYPAANVRPHPFDGFTTLWYIQAHSWRCRCGHCPTLMACGEVD